MKIQTYWGPDTPEEEDLKQRLATLYESYREEARPLLDRLVQIRSLKIPTYFIVDDDNDTFPL